MKLNRLFSRRKERLSKSPSMLIIEGESLEHHVQAFRLQIASFRQDDRVKFPSIHFDEKTLLANKNLETLVREIQDFRDVYRFLSHELTSFTMLLQFSDYITKLGVMADLLGDHPGLIPYGVVHSPEGIWTYLLSQHPNVYRLYKALIRHKYAPYTKYKIKQFLHMYSENGRFRVCDLVEPLDLLHKAFKLDKSSEEEES